MTVSVRQYYRPNGTPIEQLTDISDELKPAYEYIRGLGLNFAAEVLMSGLVSVTIEDRGKGEDVAMRVVRNGPQVQAALEEMLREIVK